MNVGTTWWTGNTKDHRGCYPYDIRYPRALRSQVEAIGEKLIVLGNDPAADRQLLNYRRLYGWWSKLEWFAPWNRDLRPCLVIDLDTFVFELKQILELDAGGLWMIRQFLGTRSLGESGLFIAPVDCDEIWADAMRLGRRDLERPGGDGAFMRQYPHRFIPDVVDGILSYKAHNLAAACPPAARVVCFHGRPKPLDAGGWATERFLRHAA